MIKDQKYLVKIKVTRKNVKQPEKDVYRIVGYGTGFESNFGGGIICTLDFLPNFEWDGSFMIIPSDKK